MHQSSYDIVKKFTNEFVNDGDVVLEIGSYDVNGSHRPLFDHCKYIGLDIEEGPNVDVPVRNPYYWDEIESNSIDIVVCASVFEHIEYPWLTIREIFRVLKWNGRFCIVAPTVWEEHKYPVDCYRYYPDGMKAMCKWAFLDCIHCNVSKAYDVPDGWYDCFCIGKKGYNS